MKREKSLLKNTLIITIGKICTQLVTFFLLPLYTGILTTEEYGIIDLLNTLVSLLLPIITFQVEMAIFRELLESRESDFKKRTIISSGVLSIIFQCVVFILLFFIISPLIKNDYKYFLIANVIASIFNSLFLQIARGIGNNTKYAVASFLSAVFTVAFNVLFLVIFKYRVTGMLLATLLGQIISLIYSFFGLRIYKYISLRSFNKETVKQLWKYSLPLIPNQISWWVFTVSDRVVVSSILGLSATGLLSVANKFPGVYSTIYGIFNLSWTENISLHINDTDIQRYFNKIFNIILNLFASMAIGMISFMPFIYPIMINDKFKNSYNLIPILILSSLFHVIVSLTAVLYISNRNTKEVANTSIMAAIINIVSHLVLIKFIGLYAAAISTFLAYFVMAFYRLIDASDKYFTIKLNKKNTIKNFIMFIIVFICYYINKFYLNIFSLMLSIIFAWNINKKYINTIFKLLKKKIVN